MKAILASVHGEPCDVLCLGDVRAPLLGPGDVRIAPEAVSLNFLDVLICRGLYVATLPLPVIPGAELVGRVLEVGAEVSDRKRGDRVCAMSPGVPGALAEEIVVPAYATLPAPEALAPEIAAVLLVTYQTAYFALHHRARLKRGETVLVHAGAGGVGTAVIQLARSSGARVIATAGGPEKVAICVREGADHAIDTASEDFVAAVMELTDGAGVDVVCDSVGGDVFLRSLDCMATEGRMVTIGFSAGSVPSVPCDRLLARNHDVLGLSWGSTYPRWRPELVRDAHTELLDLLANAQIAPLVSDVVEFGEAPAALQRLADRRTTGKTVVRSHHAA